MNARPNMDGPADPLGGRAPENIATADAPLRHGQNAAGQEERTRGRRLPILMLLIPRRPGPAPNGQPEPVFVGGVVTPLPGTRLRVNLAPPLQPRVAALLDELRTQKRRIGRDCRQHLLTQGAARRLERARTKIRLRAMRIARRHRGRIPVRRIAGLEAAMAGLKADIRKALPL